MGIQRCSGFNPAPFPVPLCLLRASRAAAAGAPRALSTYPRGTLTEVGVHAQHHPRRQGRQSCRVRKSWGGGRGGQRFPVSCRGIVGKMGKLGICVFSIYLWEAKGICVVSVSLPGSPTGQTLALPCLPAQVLREGLGETIHRAIFEHGNF